MLARYAGKPSCRTMRCTAASRMICATASLKYASSGSKDAPRCSRRLLMNAPKFFWAPLLTTCGRRLQLLSARAKPVLDNFLLGGVRSFSLEEGRVGKEVVIHF